MSTNISSSPDDSGLPQHHLEDQQQQVVDDEKGATTDGQTTEVGPFAGGVIEESRLPPPSTEPPPVRPEPAKKTPLRHRQDMQMWITAGAGLLLALVVLASVIRWLITPDIAIGNLAGAVIAPLIGLVGPIIGYFFGSNRDGP